jgi:hypothetical protein
MKRLLVLWLLGLTSFAAAGGIITTGPGVTLRCSTDGQVMQWSVSSATWVCSAAAAITGAGTTNTVAKFTSPTAIGNSHITDTTSLVDAAYGSSGVGTPVSTTTLETESNSASGTALTIAGITNAYKAIFFANPTGVADGGILYDDNASGFARGLEFRTGGNVNRLTIDSTGAAIFAGSATIGASSTAGTTTEVLRSGSLSGVLGYSTDVVMQIDAANPHNAYVDFTAAGTKGLIFSDASAPDDGYVLYNAARQLVLQAGGTATETIASGAVTISGIASTNALTVNSGSNADAVFVSNGQTAQTLDRNNVDSRITGSFNTTSGTLQPAAFGAVVTSTRSSGANSLINTGFYATVSGGQSNYAFYGAAGDVFESGNVTITPPASTVGLAVNGTTNTNGANFSNTTTGQTTAISNVSSTITGSFNTTSAQLQPAAINASITSTRSAGANSLTNTAFLASASGGQANYAFYGSAGDFFVAGNGTFGGEVIAATAASGNTALKTTGISTDYSAYFQRGTASGLTPVSGSGVVMDNATGATGYVAIDGTGTKGFVFGNASTALDGYTRYDATSRQLDLGAANGDQLSMDTNGVFARNAKNAATITLSTGTGTATVRSGAKCVCTDTTANASVKCAVATTTLTATGTGSDVIAYLCF